MRSSRWTAATALAACLAIALVGRSRACSQCMCGSPTPPGYMLGDAGQIFAYGLEDRFLSKSNALDDVPGNERQREHRLAAVGIYRPLARLALQARVPYAFKTNTRSEAGAPESVTRSHGFGDVDLIGRYDAWRFGNLFSRRGAVAVVAGGNAPTGSNQARDAAGERLDAHLQPGTGAWSGTAGVAADVASLRSALSASVMGRFNGTNAHGYHYGDALLFNLGYARNLGGSWEGTLELNGRDARRDRTEEGALDENTGGTVLYASPGLRWSGLGPVTLQFLVQVPIARSLNGDQSEKTTGRLALLWTAP